MKKIFLVFPVIMMISFSGMVRAQYCQPAYSNGCSYGDGLIYFNLNTITQVLECPWNKGYYQDCSAITTEMDAGQPYELTVQSGFPGVNVSVWIDLNDDQMFDSTEIMVRNFECSFDSTSYTNMITIPKDAPEGYHRLRYRTSWMMHVPEPCDTLGYGNAADFTVYVQSSAAGISWNNPSCFSVYPNPASDVATVEQKGEGTANIELIDLSGKSVMAICSDRKSINLDLSQVSPGLYFLKYQNGNKSSFTRFSIAR